MLLKNYQNNELLLYILPQININKKKLKEIEELNKESIIAINGEIQKKRAHKEKMQVKKYKEYKY